MIDHDRRERMREMRDVLARLNGGRRRPSEGRRAKPLDIL